MLSLSFLLVASSPLLASATGNPYLEVYPSILHVLPEPFERPNFITSLFYQTTLPKDAPPEYSAAYSRLRNASFISFDPRFEHDVVGPSAGPVQKVAVLGDGSQEMPIFLKDAGVILWSADDLTQFKTIDVKSYKVGLPRDCNPSYQLFESDCKLYDIGAYPERVCRNDSSRADLCGEQRVASAQFRVVPQLTTGP